MRLLPRQQHPADNLQHTAIRRPCRPARFLCHPSALILVLALPCLLFANGPDTVNTEALPQPHHGIAACEMFGGALLGYALGLGGLLAGGAVGLALNPVNDSLGTGSPGMQAGASVGLAAGASFGAASGAWLVGRGFRQTGRLLPTWAWTAATVTSGVVLLNAASLVEEAVGDGPTSDALVVAGGSMLLVVAPVMGAWAYNRSRVAMSAETGSRLSFGRVAMRPIAGPDRGLQPCLDLCLVNVGF